MTRRSLGWLAGNAFWLCLHAFSPTTANAQPATAALPPDLEKRVDAMAVKATAWLQKRQEPNGGWSTDRSPGITGVVTTGLLQGARLSPSDPMVAKSIAYIEGLIDPQAGHIAGKDARLGLQNYVTSVNVMALAAGGRDSHRKVIADAAMFLRKLQWDEGEGKSRDDDFYGGAGYDSKSRPDMSNTQFFLDALREAGIPSTDPAYQRALVFVSRCQNLKGEHNDRPWAEKINDGSFIYSAAAGGSTKSFDQPQQNGALPGYGSMTYAGIKSMIYCGVKKDDPRIQGALKWLRDSYTLDRNPGMPEGREEWGYFYYLHTASKAFQLLGEDLFADGKGVRHDWRREIIERLEKRQSADGSWTNPKDRWMEGDPALVTGYALMTLANLRTK
jgi:squalene-hopene/tetraprenyl-beta-curcumene cyclase